MKNEFQKSRFPDDLKKIEIMGKIGIRALLLALFVIIIGLAGTAYFSAEENDSMAVAIGALSLASIFVIFKVSRFYIDQIKKSI
jgi:hypothetical protein